MNNNSFYAPVQAEKFIQQTLGDRVSFEIIGETTLKVTFINQIRPEDLSDIFFSGAHWGVEVLKNLK
jgi:hypothetical protein